MSLYEFGPFRLDAEQLLLLRDGAPVALGPKVVETLLALLEHPGEVLGKTALLDRIWPEGFVEEANLAQNIYVLRKIFKTHWNTGAIETVPRRGYLFAAPVRRIERESILAAAATVAAVRRPAVRVFGWLAASVAVLAIAVLGTGILAASAFGHRPAVVQPQLSDAGARLYAIGRYYWNLRTPGGVSKSLVYFSEVIDADPHVSTGYSALAEANAVMGDYRYGSLSPRAYFARARAYAERALELDRDSAGGHATLGMIALRNSNLPGALAELHLAIALDPSYGPAHEWYGIALVKQGRLPEAFQQLRTASDLDPLSVATTAWLGKAAYQDRRYEDAIAYSRQALDLAPDRTDAPQTLGLAYEARGEYPQAIDAFERFADECAACRAQAAALLAHAYAEAHNMPQARTELAYAIANARSVDPADLAIALDAVGERRIAFSWLRRVHGTSSWIAIANDPRYDRLRTDADFRQLSQGPA